MFEWWKRWRRRKQSERPPASPPPPSPEVRQAIASIRPEGSPERPLDPTEVTGVIDFAALQLDEASQRAREEVARASERMRAERAATKQLSQEVKLPPKEPKR